MPARSPARAAVPPPGAAPARAAGGTTWVELAVRLPLPDAELVAEALTAFAEGASVEPHIRSDEVVDFRYRVTDAPALVRASFPVPFPPAARRALRRRLALLPLSAPLPRLRYRAVPDREWEEAWKRGFTRLRAGRRIVVCPSWEPDRAAPGEVVITLDPGRAFGTGQHATTRLCLAALEREYDRLAAAGRPAGEMLDVGTGSGILAIAAALLGAAPVRGIDLDAATVPVALENARVNGVRVAVRAGSLGGEWPWPRPPRAPVVAANLTPAALVALAAPLAAALAPGGALVVSGFTAAREREVVRALVAHGLEVEVTTAVAPTPPASGDDPAPDGAAPDGTTEAWRCITLRRPPPPAPAADGGSGDAGGRRGAGNGAAGPGTRRP